MAPTVRLICLHSIQQRAIISEGWENLSAVGNTANACPDFFYCPQSRECINSCFTHQLWACTTRQRFRFWRAASHPHPKFRETSAIKCNQTSSLPKFKEQGIHLSFWISFWFMYHFQFLGQSLVDCFPADAGLRAEALSDVSLHCNLDQSNGSFTQQLQGGKEAATVININYLHKSSLRQGTCYHLNFNILLFKNHWRKKDSKELWVPELKWNANATYWSYLCLCALIHETTFVNFSW